MAAMVRSDGRTAHQLRPVSIEIGVIGHSDGSVRYACGDTVVIAAVTGPKQLTHRPQSLLHVRITHVAPPPSRIFDAPSVYSDTAHIARYVASSLLSVIAVDAYPTSVIDLGIMVISEDGSLLATAINAAAIALMSAGIDCTKTINAVTLIYSADAVSAIVLDATREEEVVTAPTHAHVTVALTSSDTQSNQVVLSQTNGATELVGARLLQCESLAAKAVRHIAHIKRTALSRHFDDIR